MLIKRTLCFVDEVTSDAGEIIEPALRKVAVAGVIDNPFAGRFESDLSPLVKASEQIGREICKLAIALLAPHKPQGYRKGAVVDVNGEQGHCNAMLTTVFGNVMREAAGGGNAWISSITKRASAGVSLHIPLAHKDALRSHYDGITITLADAPLPNEIAIICAYANRGRPHARLAGLAAKDIKGEDGLT